MSYQNQQWGPPQGQPQGPGPQWGAPPPKKKRLVPVLLGTGAFIVTLGVISAVVGGADKKADDKVNSDKVAPATVVQDDQTATATATSAPAKHVAPARKAKPAAPAVDKVTYVVSGSTADVTYGPAGSSLSGHTPLKVSKNLKSAAFYSVYAQLQGGGHVTCKIEINGKVISQAEAAGGYNIAMCEIVQDPLGDGWVDANMG